MRNAWIVILAAFGLIVTGCGSTLPPPSEQQQVKNLAAELERKGFKIDTKTVEGQPGPVRYEHAENETAEKKRTVKSGTKTKTITVKKNTRVAEVVVVVAGNCKLEFERVIYTNVRAAEPEYLDEARNPNGTERAIDTTYGPVTNPQQAQNYMRSKGADFDYCQGKDFTPTTVDA